jgi:ATP-dependent protease HslVU (ClpYQ) peptidase subunit
VTTIACDALGMAADGRVTTGSEMIVCNSAEKLIRLRDGAILGFAGRAKDAATFAAWLTDGGDIPKLDEFTALVLRTDGEARIFDDTTQWDRCDLPAAIGSGAKYAIAAMTAGATAEEAVEIACDFDPFSGGAVARMELEG